MVSESSNYPLLYQAPIHHSSSNILYLTNPTHVLESLELTFRGKMKDANGNLVPIGEPLMNDEGINSVIGMVKSLVNQVCIMSELRKDEIPSLMNFLGDTLAKDLMMNRDTYGIVSHSARDKVYFTTISLTFVTLKRAFEAGDKRFWKGSVQEIRSSVETSQKGKGLLSALNFWNKGGGTSG